MKDPYQVLGVAKAASDDDIKKAYRQLARTLHPDLNPGDARAEERFKEVSAAYDFLSDSTRRRQYDQGEIDPTGAQKRRAWRS
ncbi:MAG: J domain-containing protein, partial [Rhodospirillaceae bacterium]|nr:J domain-containing protein [Rhodospirillales bacterium]